MILRCLGRVAERPVRGRVGPGSHMVWRCAGPVECYVTPPSHSVSQGPQRICCYRSFVGQPWDSPSRDFLFIQ
jgi:hypothetical protein